MRWLAACLAAGAVLALPAAAADAEQARSPVLTARDDGRCLKLRVGRSLTLRVPARVEGRVVVAGKAIDIAPVEYFAPTGFREWELVAVRPGRATVTGPRADGRRFRITLRVTR